jgi:hypothetical protein
MARLRLNRKHGTERRAIYVGRPSRSANHVGDHDPASDALRPRRIAWIDRNDERRIEKQADIGLQPGGAEIAGAKHAARHVRRAPRCGSSRSQTSPSIGRGSYGRRWLCATPLHGRSGEVLDPLHVVMLSLRR